MNNVAEKQWTMWQKNNGQCGSKTEDNVAEKQWTMWQKNN